MHGAINLDVAGNFYIGGEDKNWGVMFFDRSYLFSVIWITSKGARDSQVNFFASP